jgi:hypothetical protein
MKKSTLAIILITVAFFHAHAFCQSQIGSDQQVIEKAFRFISTLGQKNVDQVMSASSEVVFSQNSNDFNMFKGTTWLFKYTVEDTVEQRISFNNAVVTEDGTMYLPFSDEYGNIGAMMYILSGADGIATSGITQPVYAMYLTGTTSINEFYFFNRITDTSVRGIYLFQVLSTGEYSDSYSLTGVKQGGGPDITPPAPPTNLRAVSASAAKVNLTWKDNSSNETGFKIYRKVDTGAWILRTTTTANVQSFSDTTAANNSSTKTYQYYVVACNASGNSPSSVTATVPYQPANLSAAKGSTATSMKLTWTDKSANESGFEIYRKSGNCASTSKWVKAATLGANKTTWTDTGCTSGSTYAYKIRAYKKSGSTLFSYGYSLYSTCASSGGGGGGTDPPPTETAELKAAANKIESAFLSGNSQKLLAVMTDEAKEFYKEDTDNIKKMMVAYGNVFKNRKLIFASDNYAEYEIAVNGKNLTAALAKKEDGSWKLMRF